MSSDQDLRIHDYQRILWRRRYIMLFTFLTVVFTIYIYTRLLTPIYEARGKLRLERPVSSVALPGVVSLESTWDPWTAPQTEAKVIQGAEVAKIVVEKLGWIQEDTTEEELDRMVSDIQSRIKAAPEKQTTLINISVSGPDPKEVAQILNTTIEAYIYKGILDRSAQSRQTKEFVRKQLMDASQKLKNSEEALKSLKQKYRISALGQSVVTELNRAEEKRRELLEEFTEEHPEVKKLYRQIRKLKSQMYALPTEQLEMARFTRQVTINEELYTMLLKRYKQSEIAERDVAPTAFIVSRAVTPRFPVRPNMKLNLTVGSFLGFFLGLVFAFLAENLDTSIGTIEELEKFMELPVLGIIGFIQSSSIKQKRGGRSEERLTRQRSKLILYHKPKTPIVENYHTLRTNIRAMMPEGAKLSIIFTSAGIAEGKTLTAANFALSAAQAELKTLLIEADLRRPTIGNLFGLKRIPGITEVLTGIVPWQQSVRSTTEFLLGNLDLEKILGHPGIENLSIITSGRIPTNPVDILSSSALRQLMEQLKTRYDLIILDCPPVLLFADTLLWGPHADNVLLVYQSGRIGREALKRSKEQLINVKAHVIGVVMNGVRAEGVGPGYQYNYAYAYKYYAMSEDESSEDKRS